MAPLNADLRDHALDSLNAILQRYGAVELIYTDTEGPNYSVRAYGLRGQRHILKSRDTLDLALLATTDDEPRVRCRGCNKPKAVSQLVRNLPQGREICHSCNRERVLVSLRKRRKLPR